jgi:vitamin B12 transporter
VDPSTFERLELPDHLTGNLAAAYRIGEAVELTIRVNNLSDASYEEIAGYPAPGRRFVGGIRWQHR